MTLEEESRSLQRPGEMLGLSHNREFRHIAEGKETGRHCGRSQPAYRRVTPRNATPRLWWEGRTLLGTLALEEQRGKLATGLSLNHCRLRGTSDVTGPLV